MNRNPVGWFEVPVSDMDRAIKFYEAVFEYKLDRNKIGPLDMAWFPMIDDAPGTTGTLVKYDPMYKSSQEGTLIYYTSPSGDLQAEQDRVEAAGGKVTVPKKQVSEDHGYMCLCVDTEGNRFAIHSLK